jgi:hypothetical protein
VIRPAGARPLISKVRPTTMTIAARQALDDCREAVELLIDGVQGSEWRRRWVLAIVLLRAVGHVLDKVDGNQSPHSRSAIDHWWAKLKQTRPEPSIFWEFIDEERNSILKQYRSRAGQGVTVRVPTLCLNVKTGEQRSEPDPPLPPLYHYTLISGPFEGRDHRDVLREAIQWWACQLDSIDIMASEA